MKKLLLILFLFFPLVAFAQDRVSVRVEFKKFIWTCPICGEEKVVDANVAGGNEYEHTCINGHKFNQSGSNMKEYNGTLLFPYDDYLKVDDITKDNKKKELCDKWIYEIKHPPVYIEPSVTDLENEKANLEQQLSSLQEKINAKKIIPIISD
jgi:transcription elongation factor Elf1